MVEDVRIEAQTRWVLDDDGRVKEALVDVYRSTGRSVWLPEDKVFRTELDARQHAREVTEALSTKFGLLADEHKKRIQELAEIRVGDRVRDESGDEGTVLAYAPNGDIVVFLDKFKAGGDPFVYTYRGKGPGADYLTKIEG